MTLAPTDLPHEPGEPAAPAGRPGGGPARPPALPEPGAQDVASDFRERSLLERVISVALVGLLDWGIAIGTRAHDAGRVTLVVGLVVASAGWLAWLAARHRTLPRLVAPCLVAMAIGGGVVTAFGSLGTIYVGVAAMGAAIAFAPAGAAGVALSGLVALAVTASVFAQPAGGVVNGISGVIVGSALGFSRRQSLAAAARAAEVQVSEARAVAESARADLLDGRNHMARELHDVLAHTLSALSLRLEALDAVVQAQPGGASPPVAEQLEISKRLVRSGLDEARGAVRALRDGAPPLGIQLSALAAERAAPFDVVGEERPIGPDVGLALYRVAQEGLTNAAKHAAGAAVALSLEYRPATVVLAVVDDGGRHRSGSLSGSGAGYGIAGMRERILPLGGCLEAGPHGAGWRVRAEVPVPR
ncbi:MAG: sensor histidine kinase [Acidimicrobiales bacterium]